MRRRPDRGYFDIIRLIGRCVAVSKDSTNSYIGVLYHLGSSQSRQEALIFLSTIIYCLGVHTR